jgi:hypothetical protein
MSGGSGTGEVCNMKSTGSPYMDKVKLRAFSKNPPKQVGELLNLTINQRRISTQFLTGHCHLKGHVFKL